MNLTELFCHVDDFCQLFAADWQHYQLICVVLASAIMPLVIHFHQARYRDFKT